MVLLRRFSPGNRVNRMLQPGNDLLCSLTAFQGTVVKLCKKKTLTERGRKGALDRSQRAEQIIPRCQHPPNPFFGRKKRRKRAKAALSDKIRTWGETSSTVVKSWWRVPFLPFFVVFFGRKDGWADVHTSEWLALLVEIVPGHRFVLRGLRFRFRPNSHFY